MKLFRFILLGLALSLPAASFAQWQWIEKDGRKVFSDQPPPTDVPAKNILRQPGSKSGGTVDAVETPAAAASAASAAQSARSAPGVPKISGKDKELEEKKRKAEAVETEKKKEQEEEIAKVRGENCDRAKRSKATFDSGVRIARLNNKGEQEYLDDAARAAETKRLDGIIASDCKPAGG